MNKEFVPYEQALALKELGFNEETICVYNSYKQLKGVIISSMDGDYIKKDKWDDRLPAPTYQQAFRWFREKHNIDISINTVYSKYNENTSKKYGGVIDNESVFTNVGFYKTYEEAELECLKKLIEIVNEKHTRTTNK
jgi:hypothetical protein